MGAHWLPFGGPTATHVVNCIVAASVSGKTYFEFKGNDTKKVNIRRLIINTGASAVHELRRHTALILTSPSAAVLGKMKTSTAAPVTTTAEVKFKTASADTAAGTVLMNLGTFGGFSQEFRFGEGDLEELTINGTGETINLNCNAATDVNITILFTEND